MYTFKKQMFYFNNTSELRSINGFRKVLVTGTKNLKVYDDDNVTLNNITYKTFNPSRYIGLNNLADNTIDVTNIAYTGTEAIRVRIYFTSSTQFIYSLNSGFSYESTTYTLNSNLNTTYDLQETNKIYFYKQVLVKVIIGNLIVVPYIVSYDEDNILIEPNETNFLGEYG